MGGLRSRPRIKALLGLVVFALAASRASADTVTYPIDTGNAALSGYPGPFSTVTVDRTDPTHATFTFTGNSVGGNSYLLGGEGAVDLNVNATSWTLGPVTGTNAGTGFTPGPYSSGSGNLSSFGSFNEKITSSDGLHNSADTVTFTITNTSGTWANAADVLKPNDKGYVVGEHVFVTPGTITYDSNGNIIGDTANAANGALTTGFAVNGDPVNPEPASFALLGIGMLGLVGFAWRRRLLKAA